MNLKNLLLIIVLLATGQVKAQDKKVWASGAARSVFQQNKISSDGDTVTPRMLNSGHTLVDIAINARPNDQTFVHAKVRVRNDFGGFFGSGITFDMRQLYLKGLINNAIRYQLGDINYKLSPYTFYNNQEELTSHQSDALNIYRDMVWYDMFYNNDHTWRQQGAAVDFALQFPKKYAKELQINTFVSRNKPTDFGQQSDRIFFGGNVTLVQSDKLILGANYIDLMDVKGTSRSNLVFHNPVITGTTQYTQMLKKFQLKFNSESGISEMYTIHDSKANTLRDYFFDLNINLYRSKKLPVLDVNYINVGPQFRSIGAQSKRVNYDGINLMYGRYGNEQNIRPITQLDIMQDASLYQIKFSPQLQTFAPQYDNIQPYGKATPNRKGLILHGQYSTPNQFVDLDVTYKMLSEVVGQGVEDLRTFSALDVSGLIRIDTLLPRYKKALELTFGVSAGNTSRATTLSEGNIDLKNSVVDAGVKVGLNNNFALLFNYRMINSKGNELISVRNNYSEIIDFTAYKTEMKQQLILMALRYEFSTKSHLNIVWQKMSFEDNASTSNPFDINQFGIVYSMHF